MVTVAIARLDLSATYLREGGAPIEDPKAARRMRMIALVLEGCFASRKRRRRSVRWIARLC
jgi:hypothetical protein